MKYLLVLCLFLVSFLTQGQTVVGQVVNKSNGQPLIGANIRWADAEAGTVTDIVGKFELDSSNNTDKLIVSYVGFQTDTVRVTDANLLIEMEEAVLSEIEVVHRQKSTEVSHLATVKTENLGEKELLKAACCNLSESFETTPSVDVSFTDAITGARQIQMLGLASAYAQINRENIPHIRGISAVKGFQLIPGTWIESIQLSRGTGSVVNGFESISGQINVELRKPETADKMYLNVYANQGGRLEANANFAHRFNDKWSTALLLHGKNNIRENDMNNDGFLDMPLGTNLIALNRWKYIGNNGWRFQVGVKAAKTNTEGGQLSSLDTNNRWVMESKSERFDGWFKAGKVFEHLPWRSLGLQISASTEEEDTQFGNRDFSASQQSLYANFIYSSILSNTRHKFKTGLSFQYDRIDEVLEQKYERRESVPGAFFEYSWLPNEKLSLVAGLRGDYHNNYGFFATPRLHFRYAPTSELVIRASAGRGQRTASVFSENHGLLASARQFIIHTTDADTPYGLDAEVAWNYGVNVMQSFRINGKTGRIGLDFYRTDFENQIVVDLDQSARAVHFYNLDGSSYSNSFQVQLDYEIIKNLDARIAYRWFDINTTYQDQLLEKPLIARHRFFINLAYATEQDWSFDATLNWQGIKRIPSTVDNPERYVQNEYSPSFVLLNTQVSKRWDNKWEVYVGAENLLNFMQENPIISAENPFSEFFDGSLVWGPVFGRNVYVGARYYLN